MTEEQKQARRKSAESGKLSVIKDYFLIKDKKDANKKDKDFVFISYKSDDWKEALEDCIYETCIKYGLRVYFDTAFDYNSDLWIEQFYDTMKSQHCKAFIAFTDNAYYTSYACLMEMMASQTIYAGNLLGSQKMPHIILSLHSIENCIDDHDTGLGKSSFADGTLNLHAKTELERFDELFKSLTSVSSEDGGISEKAKRKIKLYYNTDKNSLDRGQCFHIMLQLISELKKNDNNGNSNFIDVLKRQLPPEVFDKDALEQYKKDHAVSSAVENNHIQAQQTEVPLAPESVVKPEVPVAPESDGQIYHIGGADRKYDAYYRKDADGTYTVLKGSRIWYAEDMKWMPKTIWKEYKDQSTDHVLQGDIGGVKISTAGRLILGRSRAGHELDDERKRIQSVPEQMKDDTVQKDVNSKPTTDVSSDNRVKVYGEPCDSSNQSDQMVFIFNKVLERHPDKVSALISDESMNVLSEDDYLNCKEGSRHQGFIIDKKTGKLGSGEKLNVCNAYVGKNLSLDNKKKYVRKLLHICGEDEGIVEGFFNQESKSKGLRKSDESDGLPV